MEANKKILWFDLAILLLPAVYLAYIWNHLPQTIPMHWNINGEIDRYGEKNELLVLHLMLLFTGMSGCVLMLYLGKIDPKKKALSNQKVLEKISLVFAIFFAIIQFFTLFITDQQTFISPKPILAAVALLFTFLGNLMNNVKPNYFLGIRTPWTLENEEVWRRTHHFGAKLWFWSGLALALIVLILPMMAGIITFISIVLIIAIIPMIYSYRLFKQLQKQ
jgi:uncharacterized membrane protein